MRQFTYSDAKSHKFWNIDVQGTSFTVTYGKIGTDGQSKTKTFPTEEKAQAEAEKLIKEKTSKGYVETGVASIKSDRDVMEESILANPDDLAAHAAYADLLMEQGEEARAEFIRVQLQLEDESLNKKDREKLKKREQELLKAHEREWLGELAPIILDQKLTKWERENESYQNQRKWVRGSLMSVYLAEPTVQTTRALIRASEKLPVLRELRIGDTAYEEESEYESGPDIPEDIDTFAPVCLYPLMRWQHLKRIRVLQLGLMEDENYADWCEFNCRVSGREAYPLIKQMPEIEEIYLFAQNIDVNKLFTHPMPKLRVLHVYHNDKYPLSKLAKNKSLSNLTHLLCHPHPPVTRDSYPVKLSDLRAILKSPNLPNLTHLRLRVTDIGDKGCQEIVKSGILKRLKELDLRHGIITDKGARTLAECPDLKNLQRLDVSRNCMTTAGVEALEQIGITIEASYQGEYSDDPWDMEHVFQGDAE